MKKPIKFGVTNGMRGFFAIMYDDEGPIQSGIGSYGNSKDAAREAVEWAESEMHYAEAERLKTEYNL